MAKTATQPPKKKGIFQRLLEWIARGQKKAAADGKFCRG